MAEERPPARCTITLAEFMDEETHMSGGIDVLRRRLGISKASIEAMSVSDTPMLSADATDLLEISVCREVPWRARRPRESA